MKIILLKFIKFFFSPPINVLLNLMNLVVIFRNGNAIGDHVYMTSIIRSIHKKKRGIILFTNYPEIFLNNPRVKKIFNFNLTSYIWVLLRHLKGKSIFEFNSIKIQEKSNKHFLYFHNVKNIPLAQAMSEHFSINIDYYDLKNEFFFTKSEILKFKKNFELPKNFSLIQSISKKTFTSNKNWKLEGIQNIINSFPEINWIQIGKLNEPKLKKCNYLFDLNLRQLAYVIYKCNFLVTYEGLFNHLANCFDKKNFLIHTGFLHANSINYKNNVLIEENNSMKCYPCFDLNCKDHNKNLLSNLKDEKVINIIKTNI